MKVWIVGCKGMLGGAVCHAVEHRGVRWVGSDVEVSLTDVRALGDFAARERVTHVINCAAFTNVDACESQEALAAAANDVGVGNLATLAQRQGLSALHVSTDYVFDGTAGRPYRENDPTGPLSVYGKTKLAGERRFLDVLAARGHVVRTSWLFGHGRNFVRTMLSLLTTRDEIGIVADQRGCPTYADDLAAAIVALVGISATGAGGMTAHASGAAGIYHFCNSGPTTWYDFAKTIAERARAFGAPIKCRNIKPLITAEYPTPAARPAYCVLDTGKFAAAVGWMPRPWSEALDEYLATRPWLDT